MELHDPAVLARFRVPGRCEWCGKQCWHGRDPHHLRRKGTGGGSQIDHPWNLASLCRECHNAAHYSGKPSYKQLVKLVAAREGVTVDRIERFIYKLRRTPK